MQLTADRLDRARDLLSRYYAELADKGSIDCGSLENELRARWNIDPGTYQGFKDLMVDLLDNPAFRCLAAYYMESLSPTIPLEFKSALSDFYGGEPSDDLETKASGFWDGFHSSSGRKTIQVSFTCTGPIYTRNEIRVLKEAEPSIPIGIPQVLEGFHEVNVILNVPYFTPEERNGQIEGNLRDWVGSAEDAIRAKHPGENIIFQDKK